MRQTAPWTSTSRSEWPDTTTTTFGYDYRGRRTSVADQNGKTTTYAYDDADRLTTVTDAAAPGNVTTYGYDTESNLTSIQDANTHTTSFTYDAFGRVTRTSFPSGYIETYGYDANNNLTGKTDRKNQLITYTYDQLNRLTGKTYPDSTAVNYTYDNDSRLAQVSDPTGTYQFTFDNMGRLTSTTTSYAFLAGRNFSTSYSYDKASNRTGFSDPESGATGYVYDTLNRLQTLTPPSAFSGTGSFGFSYDALSRRTQMTRPNNIATNYSYDNLSRLLSVLHQSGSTTLDGASYAVDNAGNRASRTPQPSGTASNFSYDNLYELTQVTQGASTTESYTYDPVGNRLSSLGVSPYNVNSSNELTSMPGTTYTYDNNGNTQTKVVGSNTTSFAWDFENRLTSVTLPGSGGTVSFAYDPFGRRIKKVTSTTTSIFAYDGDNLIEETNSSGAVVARYADTQNIDEPLAMLRSGATSYYHADGLGSISSLSNAAGALAQTYAYDSFGKQTASSGSLVNPFQYTARESDTETGLYYYRARYYDSSLGRFLLEDPLDFAGGKNFYRYVRNNPVKRKDPLGLYQVTIGGGLGLGSTLALGHSTGTLQTQYTFEPFGTTSLIGAATTNSFVYTGRELDATGLYFLRARYYNAGLQRFVSEDPIRFRGGLDFYSYVFNSPLNGTDPFGRVTANLGGNISVSFGGLHAQFFGGIVIDDSGNIGSYLGDGIGGAVNTGIHGSIGLSGGGSSGNNICSFAGPFVEVGGTAGLGPSGGASGYTGFERDGTPILGGSVNVGGGVGAAASVDGTATVVTPISGRKSGSGCPK